VMGDNRVERVVKDNASKSAALHCTFFYEPPEEDGVDPNQEYLPPKWNFELIQDEQIHRAVKKLNPFKAPGLSGMPNVAIKKCAHLLVPFLGPIFHATFSLKIYPTQWKQFNTVVLQKPGKKDYTSPNAY
jgi:hypothetical protein